MTRGVNIHRYRRRASWFSGIENVVKCCVPSRLLAHFPLDHRPPRAGLCAYAPADRGATKALKEEGKTQAEVAARVSTG